jgi:hypothetical protein
MVQIDEAEPLFMKDEVPQAMRDPFGGAAAVVGLSKQPVFRLDPDDPVQHYLLLRNLPGR